MTDMLVALVALLFFAPLAFIYGRAVAGHIHAAAARKGGRLGAAALSFLWTPAFLTAAIAVRLADPYELAVRLGQLRANPVLSGVRQFLELVGSLGLILFFVSIPFVMGRLFGAVAAGLGWFEGVSGNPLRFGVREGDEGQGMEAVAMDGGTAARRMTIAIDGPAAAGKGTLAKRLAAHYRLAYLDTGLLYRAVGRAAVQAGVDLDDAGAAGEVARALTPSALDDGSLRGREAGELASRVAVHPPVRAALTAFQRDFAARPGGAVLDGRDIGTVIAPEAEVKIFVTASPEVRARRRTDELAAKGRAPDYERILAEVRERDRRDMGRADAPLKPAADAHLLDTSAMTIEEAFRAACDLVDRMGAAGTEA